MPYELVLDHPFRTRGQIEQNAQASMLFADRFLEMEAVKIESCLSKYPNPNV